MRRLVIILLVVVAISGAVYFYVHSTRIAPFTPTQEVNPHRYGDPEKSIAHVRLALIYATPRDNAQDEAWWPLLKAQLTEALIDVVKFHEIQFHGRSKLDVDIYPEPVRLKNPAAFYDNPAAPSPRSLLTVSHELEERVFVPSGDLYDPAFAGRERSDEYTVMGIVYPYGVLQGWGSAIYESSLETPEDIARCLGIAPESVAVVSLASADGFFLISDSFFKDAAAVSGPSIFYHEFGHALGLPDRYVSESFTIDQVDASCTRGTEARRIAEEMTNDIMGLRKYDPLRINYLDASLLREMGVN